MSFIQQVTASSQVRSSNAVTDIENHTGKENRATYNHKNEDIDTSLSHLNVDIDLHNRRDLLENHYADTIQKHNENKNNKSEARRWDLDKYLETFEGKTVNRMGKKTTNARWSTATQISYFGSKDSLNPVLEALEEAGASPEEVREAYASGYKDYVQQHNEKFWTLPIYHSDIHFDETTPHGHDAIVVKGHTEKGRASDSINNALGEMYGYQSIDPDTGKERKGFAHNQANMVRYREENDKIIFDSIGSKLEALGKAHGLDVKFEFIRTGQTDSDDYREYKKKKDFESEVEETEQQLGFRSKAQAEISKKNVARKRELDGREKDLTLKESALGVREGSVYTREKELEEKEKALAAKEHAIREKARKLQQIESITRGAMSAMVKDSSTFMYDVLQTKDITSFTIAQYRNAVEVAQSESKFHKRPIYNKATFEEEQQKAESRRIIVEDHGPDL